MGRRMRGNIQVNYQKIDDLLKRKGITGAAFSRMLGHTDNYYRQLRLRSAKFTEDAVNQAAAALGVGVEELTGKSELQKEPDALEEFGPSDFEVEVLKLLKQIRDEQVAQKNILMYMYNEEQQRHSDNPKAIEKPKEEPKEEPEKEPQTELEIAMTILEGLLMGRGGVKYQTYIAELGKANIHDKRMADAVVAKLGMVRKTTGYGNNKTLWIAKPGWANNLKG